jgi:hypothetical protein
VYMHIYGRRECCVVVLNYVVFAATVLALVPRVALLCIVSFEKLSTLVSIGKKSHSMSEFAQAQHKNLYKSGDTTS